MSSTSFIAPHAAFRVVNLGCKVNRVESDSIAQALIACGGTVAPEGAASLVVVNTCTVTGEADKKARKAVRHALAANPGAIVVVTGCAAAIHPQVFTEMGERVAVADRAQLLADASAIAGSRLVRMGEGFRTRVGIKVQDGCDNACTYCIVHVARGPAWSVPEAEVLQQVRSHLGAGARELVLTGVNLGKYKSGSTVLAGLLEHILDLDSGSAGMPFRVRVSSIEPPDVSDDFVALLAEAEGRVCRHLHLPLQSGSSRVLSDMGRGYSARDYRDLCRMLQEKVPGISLSTDIICGFPGETEGEFAETVETARACGFSKIHVFPYSPRAGTPAAERSDQVPPDVRARRARDLRTVGAELRARDRAQRTGSEEWVLVEGVVATSESYHEIAAPAGAGVGDLVRAVL